MLSVPLLEAQSGKPFSLLRAAHKHVRARTGVRCSGGVWTSRYGCRHPPRGVSVLCRICPRASGGFLCWLTIVLSCQMPSNSRSRGVQAWLTSHQETYGIQFGAAQIAQVFLARKRCCFRATVGALVKHAVDSKFGLYLHEVRLTCTRDIVMPASGKQAYFELSALKVCVKRWHPSHAVRKLDWHT